VRAVRIDTILWLMVEAILRRRIINGGKNIPIDQMA
jgi:hypothetical protein